MEYRLLVPGDNGELVVHLCQQLRRVGFDIPVQADYIGLPVACVMAFQRDWRLRVDGKVGTKETWPCLLKAPDVRVQTRDTSPRAARMSGMLAMLWDPMGHHLIPTYDTSAIKAWEAMEAGKRLEFVVPRNTAGTEHSGTCGHATWLLTSWRERAMDPDSGLFPTWRTGRGPTGKMPLRFLPLVPATGVMYGGKPHRGLAERCAGKRRVIDLKDLAASPLEWHICQWDPGHIVVVVVVNDAHGFTDPATGIAARRGAYRLAADNRSLKWWTFKRIEQPDTDEWWGYGFNDMLPDGRPSDGPFASVQDWPLVLE